MPSGNAVAAQALYYLGYLSGEARYLEYAEACVQAVSMQLARQPMAYAAMLNAVDIHLHSATIIILRGSADELKAWRQEIDRRYLPDLLYFAIEQDLVPPAQLASKQAPATGVAAYICEGMTCREPLTDIEIFRELVTNYGTPVT